MVSGLEHQLQAMCPCQLDLIVLEVSTEQASVQQNLEERELIRATKPQGVSLEARQDLQNRTSKVMLIVTALPPTPLQ